LERQATREAQLGSEQSAWLLSLRAYFGLILVGNLIWETLHLPLYTIWTAGTLRERAFAVLHCTLGDLLIAVSTLTLAIILAGDHRWPQARYSLIASLTIVFGLAYTVFSEWLNVMVRAGWAYSDWMPIIPIAGLRIGLSPLLQWIVVPSAAFTITRWVTARHANGGRR
jgi:hypothetical protein